MAELQMEGWAELRPKLLALPDKMVNNILRASLRQAANVVRDEAKERVPVLTGALRDSIRVTARRGTRDRVTFNVVAGGQPGARQIKRYGEKGADAYYALFVEKGHWINTGKALGGTNKDRKRNIRVASGDNRFVPPHPFMLPALEATAQLSIDFVMTGISDRLESLAE